MSGLLVAAMVITGTGLGFVVGELVGVMLMAVLVGKGAGDEAAERWLWETHGGAG